MSSRAEAAKTREENEVEFARIVAFSDGVFAIAITLLILNVTIEKNLADGQVAHELWEQRESLLSYAVSFAVIARFWLVHHRFFSEVKAFDGRLMGLNMFYLGFIVLIPFSSEVLGEYASTPAAVILYSSNLIGVVLLGWLMAADARRAGLTTIDDEASYATGARAIFITAVFLLSIPVAFIDSKVAPFIWLLLFFDPADRLIARRRERLGRG
jgi:uncharacterized membrane protein